MVLMGVLMDKCRADSSHHRGHGSRDDALIIPVWQPLDSVELPVPHRARDP